MTKHVRSWAWVLGDEPPVFSIGHTTERLSANDSGFTVIFSNAPDLADDDFPEHELPEGTGVMCLNCLLDDHPERGRGLDIAREHGAADLDDEGEWVVGDRSRLERD